MVWWAVRKALLCTQQCWQVVLKSLTTCHELLYIPFSSNHMAWWGQEVGGTRQLPQGTGCPMVGHRPHHKHAFRQSLHRKWEVVLGGGISDHPAAAQQNACGLVVALCGKG
jgi:hypothetical protein